MRFLNHESISNIFLQLFVWISFVRGGGGPSNKWKDIKVADQYDGGVCRFITPISAHANLSDVNIVFAVEGNAEQAMVHLENTLIRSFSSLMGPGFTVNILYIEPSGACRGSYKLIPVNVCSFPFNDMRVLPGKWTKWNAENERSCMERKYNIITQVLENWKIFNGKPVHIFLTSRGEEYCKDEKIQHLKEGHPIYIHVVEMNSNTYKSGYLKEEETGEIHFNFNVHDGGEAMNSLHEMIEEIYVTELLPSYKQIKRPRYQLAMPRENYGTFFRNSESLVYGLGKMALLLMASFSGMLLILCGCMQCYMISDDFRDRHHEHDPQLDNFDEIFDHILEGQEQLDQMVDERDQRENQGPVENGTQQRDGSGVDNMNDSTNFQEAQLDSTQWDTQSIRSDRTQDDRTVRSENSAGTLETSPLLTASNTAYSSYTYSTRNDPN